MGRSPVRVARCSGTDVLAVGYGPFSRPVATRIADELEGPGLDVHVRLDEDVTPEMLRGSRLLSSLARW
jgi:hypothetical protein